MKCSALPFGRYRAGRENGFSFAAAVCLCPEKGSRATAFPGGDLPEAPGGKKAALSPVCNGAVQLFSAAAQRGAALHREAK